MPARHRWQPAWQALSKACWSKHCHQLSQVQRAGFDTEQWQRLQNLVCLYDALDEGQRRQLTSATLQVCAHPSEACWLSRSVPA